MNAFQDSGVEWIGEIPGHWSVSKLKNQCQIIPSNVDKKSLDNEIEVFLCNYADVYRNDFINCSLEFMTATANEHELKKFQLIKEDVLITKDSENPYDIAVPALVVETQPKLLCGYHLSIIRSNNQKLRGSYLFWVLRDASIASQLHRQATGITRWAIATRHVKNSSIPLPPLSEQQAIAAYLDKTCAAIDKAIEAKQKQLEILDALRKSIITKAVTRGLNKKAKRKDSGHIWIGRIPQEWKVEKLKYVTDLIVDGTHFTPDYIEEGVPFLRVTDIQNSQIDQNKVKRISEEAHRELCKRANPKAGDILLSKNGTIGLIKVVEWNWGFSIFVSLCLIRLRNFLSPYFFRYYFESDVVDQQLFESSKRTSVTNLHLVKIREMRIAFPRLDEQQTLVTFLDTKCAELDKLKENIQKQISTLEQYRKSLIHECVTGKRRITDGDVQD